MTVFSAVHVGCDFQFGWRLMRLQWLGKTKVLAPTINLFSGKLALKFSGRNSVHFHPVGSGKLKVFFAPQVRYAVFLSHFAFLSLWCSLLWYDSVIIHGNHSVVCLLEKFSAWCEYKYLFREMALLFYTSH